MTGKIIPVMTFFLLTLCGNAYSNVLVATLDGEKITQATLADYVSDVAGSSYASWLDDSEGLRKLADNYINRTLLLEYAKQQADEEDSLLSNHSSRKVDRDAMYLTSLLKREVHEKATVTDRRINAYLNSHTQLTYQQAQQQLVSERMRELMAQLIKKVRAGHEIKYF